MRHRPDKGESTELEEGATRDTILFVKSAEADPATSDPYVDTTTGGAVTIVVNVRCEDAPSPVEPSEEISPTAPPTLILYSERSLNLTEPGVTETMCSVQDAAFGYRYDGLVLITQEGSRLLLLPRTWSDTNGTAVVLASADALRFEFSPSVGATSPAC